MIILPESDEDLLREGEVETFRSSGGERSMSTRRKARFSRFFLRHEWRRKISSRHSPWAASITKKIVYSGILEWQVRCKYFAHEVTKIPRPANFCKCRQAIASSITIYSDAGLSKSVPHVPQCLLQTETLAIQ
jgi:hypothetical protein